MRPLGVLLPDRRRFVPGGDRNTREQPAKHAVTDDQVGGGDAGTGHRVARRRGEREQHALFAKTIVDRDDAIRRHDQPRGRAAEQAAHGTEAARAGNEDALADVDGGLGAGSGDAAHRFVSGDQRIAHAGERRHAAGVEQAFGAGADSAPLDVDDDVADAGLVEIEPGQRELLRTCEHHGECVETSHPVIPGRKSCRTSVGKSLLSVYADRSCCQP